MSGTRYTASRVIRIDLPENVTVVSTPWFEGTLGYRNCLNITVTSTDTDPSEAARIVNDVIEHHFPNADT